MNGKSKYNNKKKQFKKDGKKVGGRSESKRAASSDCTDSHTSGAINDVSYYFTDSVLKDQLANISFNQFAGVVNDLGVIPTTSSSARAEDAVPYAMRFEMSPSAGFTKGLEYGVQGNGVNLAALNLYTMLSANNAKTSQYAPQDLTTLILAIGNIISLSSHITRLFGLVYLYNQRNRAYPHDIMHVAGCDYDDLINNLAEYRVEFNSIMTAASNIPIPANIPYFKKCAEMYSGIYNDMEGSSMAQVYVFTPGTLWYFEEQYNDNGTGLTSVPLLDPSAVSEIPTMRQLLDHLTAMVGRLLNSTTLNAIYSDIIRVATKDGMALYKFGLVDDYYVVLPAYNPEIRRWINNATCIGYPSDTASDGYTIYNDVAPRADYNRIEYAPKFTSQSGGLGLNMYINFDSGNPSNDEIIDATALAVRGIVEYDSTDSKFVATEVALPDHYVNRIVVFTPSTQVVLDNSYYVNTDVIAAFAAFDWAPILYLVSAANGFVKSVTDLNYYTTVDFAYLQRLQDAKYLGLLSIR